jgi:hypothetical protein
MKNFQRIGLSLFMATLLPTFGKAQEDLFKHLYWSGLGTHVNQQFGCTGLDTVGYLNDTIRHAFALGEDGAEYLVFNRFPGDTTRQYRFPGQRVMRASMNGDKWPDFVCWDKSTQTITVLFGTDSLARFDTALVLRGTRDYYAFLEGKILVVDCDLDGYDDLIVSDAQWRDSADNYIGRIQYFRGGQTMSTTPTQTVTGVSKYKDVGGYFAAGHVQNNNTLAIFEIRFPYPYPDTTAIREYVLGQGFSLIPRDTFVCDVAMNSITNTSDWFIDIEGDSVQDLMIGTASAVFVFKGGASISRTPTFIFHKPIATGSGTFGTRVVNVGDVAGHGYSSIIVTDPDGSSGGLGNGVIDMFSIGRGLKDAYTAYAYGQQGFNEAFGSQVIPLGDLDSDGMAEFAVAADMDSNTTGGTASGVGGLYIFHGDPRYGPDVAVHEGPPTASDFATLENYPNPFSENTMISWTAADVESRTTLTMCDLLGREIQLIYDARSGAQTNLIPFSSRHLKSGTYLLRLSCGGRILSRIIQILK